MTTNEQMTIDARTIYLQWKNAKSISLLELKRILNYWESKHSIVQSGDVRNLFSKMKLLYNLSSSD